MRYIVYGSVIIACLLLATLATGRLSRVATATVDVSNNATVDLPKLRATIDMKALPRQQLPDEVYR